MTWLRTVPENADATAYGCAIQRYVAPRDWPAQLLRVPEDKRLVAEEYLRDIAARMRVLRKLRNEPVGANE